MGWVGLTTIERPKSSKAVVRSSSVLSGPHTLNNHQVEKVWKFRRHIVLLVEIPRGGDNDIDLEDIRLPGRLLILEDVLNCHQTVSLSRNM